MRGISRRMPFLHGFQLTSLPSPRTISMAVQPALYAGARRLHSERSWHGWPVMFPVEAKACEKIIENPQQRFSNDAATERRKITHIRLQKLIAS
jgi:hypothetical protein